MGLSLKPSELKIVRAIPKALTYTDIARRAGFSLPYVTAKVRELMAKLEVVFGVNFEALGLVRTYLLAKCDGKLLDRIRELGRLPYVLEVYRASGCGKENIFAKLLTPDPSAALEGAPVKAVKTWTSCAATSWRPDLSPPIVEGREAVVDWRAFKSIINSEFEFEEQRAPARLDEKDLVILREKRKYPFKPLRDIARVLGISQQLASYHYRKHVMPLWTYNEVKVRSNGPLALLEVRLADCYAGFRVMRALSTIPWLRECILAVCGSRIVAELAASAKELAELYEALGEVDCVKEVRLLAWLHEKVYEDPLPLLEGLREWGWDLSPLREAWRMLTS